MLLWLYWNPDRFAFHLPFINHPVAWYGLLFVFGIICAYLIAARLLGGWLQEAGYAEGEAAKTLAYQLTDRLTWLTLAGGIIGARLGHVFFYEWPFYSEHPLDIFKVWEGGLASHGGTLGVILGVILFRLSVKRRYPAFTLLTVMDLVAIPIPLMGAFIRLGNFINQEIVGTASDLPWAVIFGSPIDGGGIYPRHPVQLYEAAAYLFIFSLFLMLWILGKRKLGSGLFCGLFFILVFSARFALEFFKDQKGYVFNESHLLTGQILSLPLIALGICLILYNRNKL